MARATLDASSFVTPGDEMHFMCPVCRDITTESRVLPCQHWLCQQCITALTDKRCPTCRAPYTGGAVHRTLHAWLDNTEVKCNVGDCRWEGKYGQLTEHGRACKSRQLMSENALLKALLKASTARMAIRTELLELQQRKIDYQAKELIETRTRKDQLEAERRQYSENLLEKMLKKDRSRSPRKSKGKKESKEKQEKAELKANMSDEASVTLPVVLSEHS